MLELEEQLAKRADLFVSLIATAELLGHEARRVLRDHDLSFPRYNALRVLKPAGLFGLPMNEIGARMITAAPDVTRLMNTMMELGMVEMVIVKGDRRVKAYRATAKGLRMVDAAEGPLLALNSKQFEVLNGSEVGVALRIFGILAQNRQP